MSLSRVIAFIVAITCSHSVLSVPLTAPHPTLTGPHPKVNVIIDTDMAVDDWLAILLLAQHPDATILAITVTGAGEASCEGGVKNAAKIMALTLQPNVSISCGRPGPLKGGDTLFPQSWRKEMDALLEIPLPENKVGITKEHSVEVMHKIIMESKEPVTLLALGPMTNLADLFTKYPDTAKKLREVYAMAGAFNTAGNVRHSTIGLSGIEKPIDNMVAEWNVYADPLAFKQVLASGVNLTLIPLNATNKVPLDKENYEALKAHHVTPAAAFTFNILSKNGEFRRPEGWFFWDPLAAAIMMDPDLAKFEDLQIDVLLAPDDVAGLTYETGKGRPARVALDAWEPGFDNTFIQLINR